MRGSWGTHATVDRDDDEVAELLLGPAVLAAAYGVIGRAEEPGGLLVVATRDSRFAATVADKMPDLVGFGASPNSMLVERLKTAQRDHQVRTSLRATLRNVSFGSLFQPIVALASGQTIGYEALTRFDSGVRPDICFAQAWSVGMGEDLEFATLEAAVAAARDLPAGRWLDLNVSPRLLARPQRLATLLRSADRPVVIEITEHERIADYAALRFAAASLGREVRLAVDDAGVGIANFGHIVELRPDFVKLDTSLVRRVNSDPGRQALVVAMCQFAHTSGCHLIAEGIETYEEAATLTRLGVGFGQGYQLGRPEPAGHWQTT
jgi:EAL domain-containing protein (putative c-di-GMP-specific phosphodiesterase class I)